MRILSVVTILSLLSQSALSHNDSERIDDWVDGYLYDQIRILEIFLTTNEAQYEIVNAQKKRKVKVLEFGTISREIYDLLVTDLKNEATRRCKIDENGNLQFLKTKDITIVASLILKAEFGPAELRITIQGESLECIFTRHKTEPIFKWTHICSKTLIPKLTEILQQVGSHNERKRSS